MAEFQQKMHSQALAPKTTCNKAEVRDHCMGKLFLLHTVVSSGAEVPEDVVESLLEQTYAVTGEN